MRPIKFRAWDKLSKVMRGVKFIDFNYQKVSFGGTVDDLERDFKDIELIQFTGLHDKNGKEIIEGDIISHSITRGHGDDKKIENYRGVATFRDGAFWTGFVLDHGNQWNDGPGEALLKEAISSFEPSVYSCQVLGNIYENPELMKEGV